MMNYLKKIFLLCLALSIVAEISCKTKYTTKPAAKTTPSPVQHKFYVQKVADGDTVTVKNATDHKLVRIRFLCIDAPEKSQPVWGDLSLKNLTAMLPINTEVSLNGSIIDIYGRTVAEVITSKGLNVNKKMLENGMVVVYPGQKGCDAYRTIEAEAKKKNVGVWGDKNFELPWKYRERMCIGARCKLGQSNSTAKANPTTTTTSGKQRVIKPKLF